MGGVPPERPGDGPQNIYDDPRFFAGYATLERFGAGWERAMELPDFLGLLPGLSGRRVLDLGCGAGQWPCTWPAPAHPRCWGSTSRSACWAWPARSGPTPG